MQARCRSRGFTLVELLVVISIIALLISILLPSLKRARSQAKDAAGRSNLHQLGLGNQYYTNEYNDWLPWIKGSQRSDAPSGPPDRERYTVFPFRQYHQILLLHKYLKDLDIYICPRAKEGNNNVRPGGLRGPKTIKGYREGSEIDTQGLPGPISYYTAQSSDRLFREHRGELFPAIEITGQTVEEVYTEYWFNDWNAGAGGGTIPAISGNLLSRIPYPQYAVMMMDALDWNPRHGNANNFLFADAHVEPIASERYFDPNGSDDYENSKDRDAFGNRPYYCWGLGQNVIGDQ